jgi:CheY-like chemotaxis protein
MPSQESKQRFGAGKTSKRLRVLVVEDNLDTVHSLARLLKDDGHEVQFAINGYVAVGIAKQFRPDVILLDLGLPGLNGFDVCSRIKAEPVLKDVRVIAVTAYAQEADRARSAAVGCEMHIVKPYNPDYLLQVVSAPPAEPPSV